MDIKKRQDKIKQKRMNTPFRNFVKEIGSWFSIVLYKNNGYISKYPLTDRKKHIIPIKEIEKQREIFIKSGLEIDFSKHFFKQFHNLFSTVPMPNIMHYGSNENVEFATEIINSKNTYLSTVVIINCENILYSLAVRENSTNIVNSHTVLNNCDNVYFWNWIIESNLIFYSKYIKNSYSIWFSSNLISCQECLFCNDLENKSYCINNQQYTKEDYFDKKNELLSQKSMFIQWFENVNHIGKNYWSKNVTWMFIQDSENIENGYLSYQIKSWRNIVLWWWSWMNENIRDVLSWWAMNNSDLYWIHWAGAWWDNLYCSCHIATCSNIYYSYFLENCSYCLWCIGLKNKSFCILNKQYTKEEWFEKANQIFEQMDKDWTLWKFFPASMNPFYFNDTAAYLIDDSFTKEEVEAEWYLRRDEEIKVDIPDWMELVKSTELDTYQGFDDKWNWKIDPEILNKVIVDNQWNYYRIVKMEYDFLMKYWLPLPEIHWLDRIKLGFNFGK